MTTPSRLIYLFGGAYLLTVLLAGCKAPNAHDVTTDANMREPERTSTHQATWHSTLSIDCPTLNSVPLARYIGAYRGVENNLTAEDIAQDWYCADTFRQQRYPNGFVTIFGSSRIAEHNTQGDPATNAANNELYQQIFNFSKHWTQRYGTTYPILSGAGPGLMEAAGRGALEAGKSIGYTTYYDLSPSPNPDAKKFYGGNPEAVFWKHSGQDILTDGLIFSSIAVRESAMIRHSAAIVIAPGGTGTEWETFQILETLKSHQLTRVPVYIVGAHVQNWASFDTRLADMIRRNTLKAGEATQFIEFVDNPEDIIEKLKARLGLP